MDQLIDEFFIIYYIMSKNNLDELESLRSKNITFQNDGNDIMNINIKKNILELLYFSKKLNNLKISDEYYIDSFTTFNLVSKELKKIISVQIIYDNTDLIKIFKQIYQSIDSFDYIYIGIGTAPLTNKEEFFPKFLIDKAREGKKILAINFDESFNPNKRDAKSYFGSKKIDELNGAIIRESKKSLESRNIEIDSHNTSDLVDYYESNKKFDIKIFNVKINLYEKDDWFIVEIYNKVKEHKKDLLIYRVNKAGGHLFVLSMKLGGELFRNNTFQPYILATFKLDQSGIEIGHESCKK